MQWLWCYESVAGVCRVCFTFRGLGALRFEACGRVLIYFTCQGRVGRLLKVLARCFWAKRLCLVFACDIVVGETTPKLLLTAWSV